MMHGQPASYAIVLAHQQDLLQMLVPHAGLVHLLHVFQRPTRAFKSSISGAPRTPLISVVGLLYCPIYMVWAPADPPPHPHVCVGKPTSIAVGFSVGILFSDQLIGKLEARKKCGVCGGREPPHVTGDGVIVGTRVRPPEVNAWFTI